MKLSDPQYGPLLSAVILVLLFLIAFLTLSLPFSPNAGVQGGVIGTLGFLLGAVINLRGRIDDRRGKR